MSLIDPNLPRVFKASGPKGSGPTAPTPLQALQGFLQRYPPLHETYEKDVMAYVLSKDWLNGSLKPPAKIPLLPDAKRAARHAQTLAAITRWESKARRAETALKKLRRRERYYAA